MTGVRYTDQQMLVCLRRLAFGDATISRNVYDQRHTPGIDPTGSLYERRFGTWNNALQQAGLDAIEQPLQLRNSQPRWTDEQMLTAVLKCLEATGKSSHRAYAAWRDSLEADVQCRVPAAITIRFRFSRWSVAVELALTLRAQALLQHGPIEAYNDWVANPQLEHLVSLLAEQTQYLPDSFSDNPAQPSRIQEAGVGCNCAEGYVNDVFALRDFCWCDETLHPWNEETDGPGCPPNFEHFATGLKGRWYKHRRRSVVFDRVVTLPEMVALIGTCTASLLRDRLDGGLHQVFGR